MNQIAWDKNRETLVSLVAGRFRGSGHETALLVRSGARSRIFAPQIAGREYPAASDNGFEAVSWSELADDVRRVAWALGELGVGPGDRVGQVSGNRYLWIVIDLAVHLAGAVHVAVHAALSPEQMAWQLRDSGSRLAIGLSNNALLARATELVGDAHCHLIDDPSLVALAIAAPPADIEPLLAAALQRTTPARLATILYTSGTTAEPKGVMLSHGNLAFNALAAFETFEPEPGDLRMAWLPLSHIFARTSDLYIWLASGIPLALAESRETLLRDLAAARPTVLNGVPYFYEKLERYLESQGRASEPGALQGLLGGRMRFLCSGGAPLADHTAEFYRRQGVLLTQGYGLTETSPVITTGGRKHHRLGTVGPPIPGVEVRIADDGEILTRGPHVMLGYWNRPADTAAVINADGWLATGDLGAWDEGHLRIVGRKKEMLVLTNGKKVSPAGIESRLTADPLVAQAMLVGDGRRFLTALIVPDVERLREELAAEQRAAGRTAVESGGAGPPPADPSAPEARPTGEARIACEPLDHPAAPELLSRRIAQRLAECAEWEQVGKFIVLTRGFSQENGQLTPTLKPRRAVIEHYYSREIELLYADSGAAARAERIAEAPQAPGDAF